MRMLCLCFNSRSPSPRTHQTTFRLLNNNNNNNNKCFECETSGVKFVDERERAVRVTNPHFKVIPSLGWSLQDVLLFGNPFFCCWSRWSERNPFPATSLPSRVSTFRLKQKKPGKEVSALLRPSGKVSTLPWLTPN